MPKNPVAEPDLEANNPVEKKACDDCNIEIPADRLNAVIGVTRCIVCQQLLEKETNGHGGYSGNWGRVAKSESNQKKYQDTGTLPEGMSGD